MKRLALLALPIWFVFFLFLAPKTVSHEGAVAEAAVVVWRWRRRLQGRRRRFLPAVELLPAVLP